VLADDPPKDKKEGTPKEQYAALVKEVDAKRQELSDRYTNAAADEKPKVLQQLRSLNKDYAGKFLKLAEDNAKDPAATDALFWIVANANGTEAYQKASEKAAAAIAEAPLADLMPRLNSMRFAPPAVVDAVVKRAEKEEKDPKAVDLAAWVATRSPTSPAGQRAIKTLVEKNPDSPAVAQMCPVLGSGRIEGGEAMLRTVLEKTTKPATKAAAALALGQNLAGKVDELGDKPAEADKLAAEGEKYFTLAVELLKDSAVQKKQAEGDLKALRTLRVGKPAPEIKASDLDGKDFKLSDYRGKVVLLDFWGNW
jgi:hypothetical protein